MYSQVQLSSEKYDFKSKDIRMSSSTDVKIIFWDILKKWQQILKLVPGNCTNEEQSTCN